MDIEKEFNEKLWILNPPEADKNYSTTLSILQRVLDRKEVSMITGFILNINDVIESYNKYFSWWKSTYGQRDPQYIGKNDKQHEIYTFLEKKEWNKNYNHIKSERDYYLFDDFTEKQLKESLKTFLNEKI